MGAFFVTEEVQAVNEWAIRKEGYLNKQSRHLNSWRKRWVVLHHNYLFTFKEKVYTNPTEEIDLRIFREITAPKYNKNLSTYTITLKCDDQHFKFSDNDSETIQKWYHAINRSIRANNDNLICNMLSSEIITGPIASYLIGYQRFNKLSLINKHFSKLFDLSTFDFHGVYFSDSIYFLKHFYRFYDLNYFAVKQGLYRSFYNPEQKYMNIYIDKIQRKQLLYMLISYGPLINGAKKYDKIQREKFKKMHKTLKNDKAPDILDNNHHCIDMKEEEEEEQQQQQQEENKKHIHQQNIQLFEKKDEINFQYEYNEYNEREYAKMECIDYNNKKEMRIIEIPQNIIKFDFSRHLNKNSKLVALTFSEVRNEEEDESQMVENTEIRDDDDMEDKKEEEDDDYDEDNDEPHFNNKYIECIDGDIDNNKHYKLHYDVKWICNLLLWSHIDTFKVINILDLSYNAWDEYDIILISDSILRRDNNLSVRQILLDGIPFLNELKRSNKAITKLFQAISSKCNKLEYLSLKYCLLRDESMEIILNFYKNNRKTSLMTLDLINNNITERGVDILNEISSIVSDSTELAFVVGSFYLNDSNKWNTTIKTDDDYVNRRNYEINQ